MENKNTNFDILELLDQQIKNESAGLLIQADEEESLLEDPIFDTHELIAPEENTFDILETLETQKETLSNEVSESPVLTTQEHKKSIGSIVLGNLIFLVKYITTSTVIFMLLLSASNYSAYIEIARSYLNPEALEQNRLALLSSVNGANINSGDASGSIEEEKKDTLNQKVSMVKNKTYHSMDKLLSDTYDETLNMQIDIVPYENRVIIPKIGKNIPLIDVQNKTVQNVKELEDVFMNELSNGVVRYPGSARPGETGNAFIFGHSSNFPWIKGDYNDVFALLDNVVFGDEIIVYYNQKKYTFKIKEKKVIKPGDVSVLKRNTQKPEISLMTCWPVGTTLNRMIVVGELVN